MSTWNATTEPTGRPRWWSSTIRRDGQIVAHIQMEGTRREAEKDARDEMIRLASA
jgi:hypothetical protein